MNGILVVEDGIREERLTAMKTKLFRRAMLCALAMILGARLGCARGVEENMAKYICEAHPIQRNGCALHLDCVSLAGTRPDRQILLLHGSTYSSHIFDVDYMDYSLVLRLAREGYGVWRLDIAGYGRSGAVADGFMPDTAYAARDIDAAVEAIVRLTDADRVDVLGWSWGTMTAGRYAAGHPAHLGRLVLYGPVLVGLEGDAGDAPFSRNTWEGAAEDFQRRADGGFDQALADPVVIDIFCSGCWRYDGDSSPNGWRRDAFAGPSARLIDLDAIDVPTLLICGSEDPYMDWAAVAASPARLPEGSRLEVIPGGSHIVMYEKPYYRDFQDRVVRFLEGQ